MLPWKPFIVSGLELKQKVKPQSGALSGVTKEDYRLRARSHLCDLFPSNSFTMASHSPSSVSRQTGLPAR
jgi:hypothetical protein